MPPYITEELLRKKCEHNEGMISTLEEVTLHQEELESMRGVGCMKYLKILYLQNNIISKMEDLHHCKQLEYLNIGLNCIAKVSIPEVALVFAFLLLVSAHLVAC